MTKQCDERANMNAMIAQQKIADFVSNVLLEPKRNGRTPSIDEIIWNLHRLMNIDKIRVNYLNGDGKIRNIGL